MTRPTKAIVDLAALRSNYQLACEMAPASQTLAVIKANAYGHGIAAVARALNDVVPAFAVACIEEAFALREAGIDRPVLLLEGPFSSDEVLLASEHNFWLMVTGVEQVARVCRTELARPVKVWMKIDSGMHRLGITEAHAQESYNRLKAAPWVEDEIVLATHFSSADDISSSVTELQIDKFRRITSAWNAPASLANSAGLLHWESARSDWNRAGIMLYGATPFEDSLPQCERLTPVMALHSEVIGIRDVPAGDEVGYSGLWQAQRDSCIATVAIGYADGYPRGAAQGTPVLVNGHRAALAGRVSMDMITVDVTDLPEVEVGTPVELWGKNISVNEVARCAGTISYELLARMPARTPRVYVDAAQD